MVRPKLLVGKNWNEYFFPSVIFFLQSYAISKRMKLQWPATSHLKDFLQSFQTVMNFLCLRPIVKQKLSIQNVICPSCFYSLVPPHHRPPCQIVRLDGMSYGAHHPSWRRIHPLLMYEQHIHPYLALKFNSRAMKYSLQKTFSF